jgi:hypothetical protein
MDRRNSQQQDGGSDKDMQEEHFEQTDQSAAMSQLKCSLRGCISQALLLQMCTAA